MSSMSTDSNATHKSDLELATDIGRGLLSEINRMRTVLQEKQESLSLLESTRWENEQKMHELYGQLTHKCELETRYKEDINNLEITKQNLTFQISQLKTTIRKLQSEHHVQQNKQNLMQRELETLKCSQKNLQTMTIRTQIKHETTLFELNQTLERLRSEKQILLNQLKGEGKSNELDSLMREAQETIENVQQGNQDLVTAAYDGEHARSETDKDSSYDSESIQEIEEKAEQVESRDTRIEDTRVEDTVAEDTSAEDTSAEDTSAEDIRIDDTSAEDIKDINSEEEEIRKELKIKEEKEDDDTEIEKYLPVLSHTMAGEKLNKYVRHPVKAKFSNSHSRYFWLHPFTKTLYWSENKPEHGESKLKSMPIQSFSIIKSTHQIPIICIQSFNNQMKIHCSSLESFSKWSQSLECLFMKPVYNKTMNRLSQLSV